MAVNTLDWPVEQASGSFPLIPEGTYDATLTDVVMQPSKSSGTDQFVWTYTFEGTDDVERGCTKLDYTALSKQALWKLRNVLVGLGMDGDAIIEYSDPVELLQHVRENFIGVAVSLDVVVQSGNDKYPNDSNQIKRVTAV